MISLRSERLRVELPEPGECPNNTHRFDSAGFVSEVILDGSVRFCASEPRNLSHPCSGGRGLCSEFKSDRANEVNVGMLFPKFGVGLIRKEDGRDYVFHRRYKEIIPYPVKITADKSFAEFVTEPIECNGCAVRTVRRVEVEDASLTIRTEMCNAGVRSIDLLEYCHNFISIDGMALSDSYRWESPQLVQKTDCPVTDAQGVEVPVRRIENGFRFARTDATAFGFWVDMRDVAGGDCFDWRLTNDAARAFVEVHESFLPQGIQIWSSDHMICPEVFKHICAAPGESCVWTRRYRFDHMD